MRKLRAPSRKTFICSSRKEAARRKAAAGPTIRAMVALPAAADLFAAIVPRLPAGTAILEPSGYILAESKPVEAGNSSFLDVTVW